MIRHNIPAGLPSGDEGNVVVKGTSAWESSTPADAGLVTLTGTQTLTGTKTLDDARLQAPVTTVTASEGNTFELNMDGTAVQTVTPSDGSADLILSMANREASIAKSITVKIRNASGSSRTFGWSGDGGWQWATDRPTTIADGIVALLTVMSLGAADSDTIVAYKEVAAA